MYFDNPVGNYLFGEIEQAGYAGWASNPKGLDEPEFKWPVVEYQQQGRNGGEHLFVPARPKAGFGQVATDFRQVEKTVNKGHGRLEKRRIQTGAMLDAPVDWRGVRQVYRMERHFTRIRRWAAHKTKPGGGVRHHQSVARQSLAQAGDASQTAALAD